MAIFLLATHVHVAVSISQLAMRGWAGLWPVCPATPLCGKLGELGFLTACAGTFKKPNIILPLFLFPFSNTLID